MLTDHYDPAGKTVNLSEPVYGSATVAAAAVAAHECGHAVQHAKHYPMLALRSGLVPVVQIGSRLAPVVLMAGLALAVAGQNLTVLLIGITLFAGTTSSPSSLCPSSSMQAVARWSGWIVAAPRRVSPTSRPRTRCFGRQ
jgi:Putative neutral zinc metallopeptidase